MNDLDSLATAFCLPRINERNTSPYLDHTTDLGETDDKARISLDHYRFQMAAVARQAALDLLRGRKPA